VDPPAAGLAGGSYFTCPLRECSVEDRRPADDLVFVGMGEKRGQLRPAWIVLGDGSQAGVLKLQDGDIGRVHSEIQAQSGVCW
jgi:hypothetical protein